MSTPTPLHCDQDHECQAPITHIDREGYIYCAYHGNLRKLVCPCRKLRPAELTRLHSGEPLERY